MTREKTEAGEFPTSLAGGLKEKVETLLIWLEAYNLIKPEELGDLTKNLWSNLPTASALNISFSDPNAPNFLRQLFGAAHTLPQGMSPYFLGQSETRGSAIIFFKNAYRCLSHLLNTNPSTFIRILDTGILSHIKHMLLAISYCFQQWELPSNKAEFSSEISPSLVFEDYYELLYQILKVFNKLLDRIIIANSKGYSDIDSVQSILMIIPHVIRKCQNNKNMLINSVLTELFKSLSIWSKQDNFIIEQFIPKITELLVDLPEKRLAGLHLLAFLAGILNIRNQQNFNSVIFDMLINLNPLNSAKKSDFSDHSKKSENSEEIKKKEESDSDEISEKSPGFAEYLIKSKGTLLNFILEKIFDSSDLAFISTGITLLKFLINTMPQAFSEKLCVEFTNIFTQFINGGHRLSAGEMEFSSTPTSHKFDTNIIALCKRLLIFKELIPTMLKFVIIKQNTIENIISMLKYLWNTDNSANKSSLFENCEKLLIEILKSLISINPELLHKNLITTNEILPNIAQLQRILGIFSQKAIIDPPTYLALSNKTYTKNSLILTEYLEAIHVFIRTNTGKLICLFSDYVLQYPTTPKPYICFKELIDQCVELRKMDVDPELLVKILNKIFDILAEFCETDLNKIPDIILQGIFSMFAGDLGSVPKLFERIKEFFVQSDLNQKIDFMQNLFTLIGKSKDANLPTNFPEFKIKPTEQIFNEFCKEGENRTLQSKFLAMIKPKTLKRAEGVYFIKNSPEKTHDKPQYQENSLYASILKMACFEKLPDDWIVEKFNWLENSLVSYFADINFIIQPQENKTIDIFAILYKPELLQLEHANLPLSIQTMKRKQREEVEKKRKSRSKPIPQTATTKFVPFTPTSVPMPPRKPAPATQQPSRNISTHVDVFEGLDRTVKNPFPQLIRPASSTGKPGTPTNIMPERTVTAFNQSIEMARPIRPPMNAPIQPPISMSPMNYSMPGTPTAIPPPPPVNIQQQEEKPVSSSKVADVMQLLNKLKGESKQSSQFAMQVLKPTIPYPQPQPSYDPTKRPMVPGQYMQESSPANISQIYDPNLRQMQQKMYPQTQIPNISSPSNLMTIVPMEQLSEEERNVFAQVRTLKIQRGNDPRTQEQIAKLLKSYPRVVPHLMALLKK